MEIGSSNNLLFEMGCLICWELFLCQQLYQVHFLFSLNYEGKKETDARNEQLILIVAETWLF